MVKREFKKWLKRMADFAKRHNINPKVFLWLLAITELIRWTTLILRTFATINGNPSVDIPIIVINRLTSLVIPVYVISRGKSLLWLKITYTVLFIWGTLEIVGIKFFSQWIQKLF